MITDDLRVFPNSMNTTVNVLQNSGIRNVSFVSEMTVNITKNQVFVLAFHISFLRLFIERLFKVGMIMIMYRFLLFTGSGSVET